MPTARLMRLKNAGLSTVDGDSPRPRGVSSVHFLKLVEDQGKVGFWTLDFVSGDATCSIGVYRILSLDPSAAINHIDMLEMIHPDDRRAQENLDYNLRQGQSIDAEFRVVRPDGSIRWVGDRAQVIFDAESRPIRAIGMLEDLTECRETKLALDREADRHRMLVSLMGGAEWRADCDGRVTLKQDWFDLTGQRPAEAQGSGWLIMVSLEGRKSAERAWHAAISSGSLFQLDTSLRCKGGDNQKFHIRAQPLLDPGGSVREWTGLVFPIEPLCGNESARTLAIRIAGRHIRAARALLDWSHQKLALAAGVSVSSVRRLENGREGSVRPSLAEAVKLALEQQGIMFGQLDQNVITVSLRYQPVIA